MKLGIPIGIMLFIFAGLGFLNSFSSGNLADAGAAIAIIVIIGVVFFYIGRKAKKLEKQGRKLEDGARPSPEPEQVTEIDE